MPLDTEDDCGVGFADQLVAEPPKLNAGRGGCAMKDGCDEVFGLAGTAPAEGPGVEDIPVGNIGEGKEVRGVALSSSAPCSFRNAGAPEVKDENGVDVDEEKEGSCCCD